MQAVPSHVIGLMSLLAFDGPNVKIVQQLSRPDYTALNKVLEACGGKWNRKAQAHVFDEDPSEILDAVMQTGQYFNKKKSLDQFDSTQVVIDAVIELAKFPDGERGNMSFRTLEPSAGVGMLATAAARFSQLDAIELDEERSRILRANPLIDDVTTADFLTVEPNPIYNRIIMNPPFSKQQDIDHVLHALRFLEPGGILVSVMSAGVLFRMNKKTVEFRYLVEDLGGTFHRLPDGAFSASGTEVSSVVVRIQL